MNENNIQTLNREEFTTLGLIDLQKIYLKKSNIKYLHREAFKNLKILVELDLSENMIEQLDKQAFSGNDRLRILLLYGNPIKRLIADQFPVLSYLRTIDLHSCEIVSIDETSFSNVDLLEYLDLKQNQLQNLPGNVFTHMKNLKTLMLDENPWNCDCKLKNFRNWYVKNNPNRKSLQCKSPYSLHDHNWEAIHEDAFGCAPILRILNEDVSLSDLESNITFKCFTTGDPRPTIGWQLDGKEIENDNVVIEMDETVSGGISAAAPPPQVSSAIDHNNNKNNNNNHNGNKIWSNLSIYNITNLNAGFYTCFARNDIGYASQNVSLLLPEVGYEHVVIKNDESVWYVGLIVGIIGTITFFMSVSILFCVCKRLSSRRRIKKRIKGSVSFNDQEKKLLDLSITTTTDRDRDYSDMLNTPSSATNKTDSSIIALEPVQITIENFHHPHHNLQYHHNRRLGGNGGSGMIGEDYPLNIGIFPPPPPEFCSSVAAAQQQQQQSSIVAALPSSASSNSSMMSTNGQLYPQQHHLRHNLPHQQQQQQVSGMPNNPQFGNIFISVSLTQDALDNDLNMYPDLLNIMPNRIKNSSTGNNISSSGSDILPASQIVPINIESYATLPRNKLLNASPTTSTKAPVSILKQTTKNYDKPRMMESESSMAGLIISSNGVPVGDISKCISCSLKSDNMGLRVTASGNTTTTGASALSIPDEELEDQELAAAAVAINRRSDSDDDDDSIRHEKHHLNSTSYHPPPEAFEQQLSPPSKSNNQQSSSTTTTTSILMPSDFVSL